MASLRHVVLSALLGTVAQAGPPSAVQLCLTLPEGVALYSPTPAANYRALGPDTYVLDLDFKLNGRLPDRLTRNGPSCLRAWLAPVHVTSVSVSFERTLLNLAPQARPVNLQLKADLWYDAGQLSVLRQPWATVSTPLPGVLTLARQSEGGAAEVTDLARVPAGTYRVAYQPPPPPRGPCRVTIRATGVGTIRADNRPALFAELVEAYRTEWLPEVLKAQQLTCTRAEAVEVSLRLFDGAFRSPLDPELKRVELPVQPPRFALVTGGVRVDFQSGQTVVIGPGDQVVLEAVSEETVAAVP
jgi:hypothetical protein